MSQIEEENETSLDHESESDEDIFWDSISQPEEDNETDIPETVVDDKKYEFNIEPIWDNTYKTETVKDVPKLNKVSKKIMVRLRKDFITKLILFSVIIGRFATAKEIGGMVIQNKIQKGNLPHQYLVEQSNEEIIREKIDEEVIRANDCMEESMANAEISLNPPCLP